VVFFLTGTFAAIHLSILPLPAFPEIQTEKLKNSGDDF
jgi:hypothetical protein